VTRILAIDPGNTVSGYALIDSTTRRPIEVGKIPNDELLDRLLEWCVGGLVDEQPLIHHLAIEMIASYGMAVGKEVFETCVWIGRFIEVSGCGLAPIYRRDVKLHHCLDSRAKDSNIRQALVDRFAPGQPNHGKGTKSEPGWFHGFRADVWQAYALAVLVADRLEDGAA